MPVCPKCGNPFVRHKGKRRPYVYYVEKDKKRGQQWSEKGYICKKCGYESESLDDFKEAKQ